MRVHAFVAVTVLMGGCASDPSEDAVSSDEAMVTGPDDGGTWKLYAQPGAQSDPQCDEHTALVLSRFSTERNGRRAVLFDALSGSCKKLVEPQQRSYHLLLDSGWSRRHCGSLRYVGERLDGKGNIVIIDHRKNNCDAVEAELVVEETIRNNDESRTQTMHAAPEAWEPTVESTWLGFAMQQCNQNPWKDEDPVAYFASKGFELEATGYVAPSVRHHACLSCVCSANLNLVVKVKSAAAAKALALEYGFGPVHDALTTGATQCGTSPWEEGQDPAKPEVERLFSWAQSVQAPLAGGGFIKPAQPVSVCQSCSCPRGDSAFAIPKDASASAQLRSLGWTDLEN
ncbi:MAG: hypothetical protein KF782_29390 [Labilithrix sp.]|nr:hypothetical protein [Labilithrix sp.]